MKIAFYDSGLGGLSVLKEFMASFGAKYKYFYFGDSARAPYGNKTKEQLKLFVLEILEMMEEVEADVVVSACNTSSMLLHEIDLDDYPFKTISLFDVMNDYFSNEGQVLKRDAVPVALLATSSNIDMGRYKDWGLNIQPVKCPEIVPLVEAGDLEAAKLEWQKKLAELGDGIKHVIIGCTHYSFLCDKQDKRFIYIDPAELCVRYFSKTVATDVLLDCASGEGLKLELKFSKSSDSYLTLAKKLCACHPEGDSLRHPEGDSLRHPEGEARRIQF